MVQWAKKTGVHLEHEDGIKTIQRGVSRFGVDCLVLISFLWTVARHVIEYCYSHKLRVLIYDKFIYYKGSSELVNYGSALLRGVRGIKWQNCPITLREGYEITGHKPMLEELMRGPLFFDAVKGIQQMSLYCEMYPNKVCVSMSSKIDPVELREMSLIHHFRLVDEKPVIWFVRCPHNAGPGLTYDIDKWEIIASPFDINACIIGSVPVAHMVDLFPQKLITKGGTVKGPKGRKRTKIIVPPRTFGAKIVSKQNMKFRTDRKYYLNVKARLIPEVRPIYVDDVVQLVWLRGTTYQYEEGNTKSKFISYTLNA
jgi:hypothetical protein